ncbi:ABC transporter F family member 4-like [Papaver somniferum]|uniref:ABC transporter F family member 4-like n=1 Tax=Papaver somniferum TaxID=3469 RepID=UPI000E6FD213|nr:ABC transporter F family member 4-like [Papaver somniferum]
MAAQMIANHRENAETYTGDEICKAKSLELLHEISLPDGLLPLEDIIEVGYNRTSGFVWLRQKKKKEHYFKSIGKPVSYATEVTAFVEKHRMKKITGVKSKDTMLWVNISDIFISDPSSGKITFKTPFGLSRTFPVSAFVNEETEEEKKRKKERAEEEEKKKKMEEEAEEEKEKTRKQTDEEKKMMEEVEAEEKKKENAEDQEKKKMDEVEDEEKKKMMEENEEEKKVENVEDQEKKKMEKVEVDEEKKKIEEVKA